MKQELVSKGALSAWDLPTHVEFKPEEKKPATLTPIEKLWTDAQRNQFGAEVLLIGGWFLECRPNYVPVEEKDLVPLPKQSLAGDGPMEIDDDDNEDAFEPEPAPKQKTRRKARGRNGTVVASPPTVSPPAAAPPPVAPHAIVRLAECAPLASTQASQHTVLNPPSPRRSHMDVDSGQTLNAKQVGRGIPIPKGLGATSSSSFQLTLPMFLEQGSFSGLLSKSQKQHFMDPQLVRVVDHIIKVTLYNLKLLISI